MPLLLGPYEGRSPAAQKWHAVLKVGMRRRTRANDIASPLRELAVRHRALPDDLATIIIGLQSPMSASNDPLLITYIELMMRLRYIGTNHLLLALLRHSRFSRLVQKVDPAEKDNSQRPPAFEEAIFVLLGKSFASDTTTYDAWKAHGLAHALTKWMTACNEFEMMKQLDAGGLHTPNPDFLTAYEALGLLVHTVFGNQSFRAVERAQGWKEKRRLVVNALTGYITLLAQSMQSRVTPELQNLLRAPPLAELDTDGFPVFTDDQIQNSIHELPIINSRAGLYIWLNALLCARPLTDDLGIFNYLHARYNGNTQTLTVDLLVAAFDCLTNSLLRKEQRQHEMVIRSFICNKIPTLLALQSSSAFATSMVEPCVQVAFATISMNPVPPLSSNSNNIRETLKITRLEFLQACALHSLISESTIAAILQEPPMAMPRVTKHTKENLVAQCIANASRVESLVDDLGAMQGNGSATAEALIATIQNLCESRDTMSLKTVCSALTRRMTNMDIILQYITPSSLLVPLCTLLNGWTHDEDQSEYQPPYEEFASILLLIMATIYRYDLSRADIGLASGDNFMQKLLERMGSSIPTEDLTEEQSKQLSKWIQGLYATDEHGETTGIGDEVMSHCPPQDFYLLVPTLFEQSVQACKSGSFSVNTFIGGLEFLLEPFLLPSLIGGLSWLVKHSWEDHGDGSILIRVLQKLLRPSSSSQETQAMHKAILSIVASPLESSLQDFGARVADRKEVLSLIENLRPYMYRQRTTDSSISEVARWDTGAAGGGIGGFLRKTFQDLVVWASQDSVGPPAPYTHRILVAATDILGTEAVVDELIAELQDQTNRGHGSIAMDVATAMICAPTAETQSPALNIGGGAASTNSAQMSIREFLQLRLSNTAALLKMVFENAETLIRLGRRVQAQLTISQLAQLPMQMPIQDIQAADIMQSMDISATDLAAEVSASLDQDVANGSTSTADFSANEIAAVMAQPLDLSSTTAEEIASMTDPNTMQLDPSQNMFGDLSFDFAQQAQSGQSGNDGAFGRDGNNVTASNQEEDIFADLDMGDMGDMSDFNF